MMIDMDDQEAIDNAKGHFEKIIIEQLSRVERLKSHEDWIDYSSLKPIVIGLVGGDGIGPYIMNEAKRILKYLLGDKITSREVEVRDIKGLTIENRSRQIKSIPEDIMRKIKSCHVILKGPTTTPRKGDTWPNLESANIVLRRELDLFVNIRPVKIPELGIDWIFFRENSEGAYILGSSGINVSKDLAMDFKVITSPGAERIIDYAFSYAQRTKINKVTVVTKANVIKTTDGKFLEIAQEISERYPEVEWDDWYIDIMAAKLLDPIRRDQFRVIVLPNLYGDIISDEAAQIQGGVGTAGSANIGFRYAMFEAIHGSAPRMVAEGRARYADPASILRALVMMLGHVGYENMAETLKMALDICFIFERKKIITGHDDGATSKEISEYVIETLKDPGLEKKWESCLENIKMKNRKG
jgi:isocitrate dehydrogenase (NAD+)